MKIKKNISWLLPLSVLTILSMSGCGGDGENGASSNENLLYERVSLPLIPTEPTYPTYPTDPTNPEIEYEELPQDPTAPINPVDPTDPTNPPIDSTSPEIEYELLADIKVTYDGIMVDNGVLYISEGDTTTVFFDGSGSKVASSTQPISSYIWSSGDYLVKGEKVEASISCDEPKCSPTVTDPTCTYEVNLEVSDGELSDDATVIVVADFAECPNLILPGVPGVPGVPGDPGNPGVPVSPSVDCSELLLDYDDLVDAYIAPGSWITKVGENLQFVLWGVWENGCEEDLSRAPGLVWLSGIPSVATIQSAGNAAGTATSVGTGLTIITGKYQGPNGGPQFNPTADVTVTD